MMWRRFFDHCGVRLHAKFDISTLALMSEGFTPATMKQVQQNL